MRVLAHGSSLGRGHRLEGEKRRPANREIRVRQSAPQVEGKIASKAYGKTSAAWRTVTYPQALHPAMVAACKGKIGDALVFPNTKGKWLRRPDCRDGWFCRGREAVSEG